MHLLQVTSNAYDISVLLFVVVLGISLQALVLRWVFKINEQVKNQQATIWLLIKLCDKTGVDKEELDRIISVFKIK